MMNLLLLTCANLEEAQNVAHTLLEKRLVICTKITNVRSEFLWKGSIDKSEEVLLMMESHDSKFDEVEKAVKELHSYEQFVLVSLPITRAANGVENWMKTEMSL